MRHRFLAPSVLGLLLMFGFVSAVSAEPEAVADIVKTKALSSRTALEPGKTVRVGVLFDIAPDWHIYWENPGESGFATEVKWTVPTGYKAGPTLYPAPIVFTSPGPLTSYGYAKQVLLMTDIEVPADALAGSEVELVADAKWLMCSDRCIPGKEKLTLKLPVGPGQAQEATLFERYSARVPAKEPPAWLSGSVEPSGNLLKAVINVKADGMTLVGADKGETQRKLAFFPFEQDRYNVSHPTVSAPDGQVGGIPVYTKPAVIELTLDPLDSKTTGVPSVGGVLVYQEVESSGRLKDVKAAEFTILPAK
ncbi:MAG: protein-disulfide reductase DsbD family protein [Candidatus Sumerlaeaceae bacterium]|nr:protein-disulfide reductase DsbD family protein [Candidatus Sumerlaeaceae bacterium]